VWLEVTNKDDTPLSNRGYRALAAHLREHAYRNSVHPGETRSGFIFVNLDQGAKEIKSSACRWIASRSSPST
jgi:hypothetical protein